MAESIAVRTRKAFYEVLLGEKHFHFRFFGSLTNFSEYTARAETSWNA